MCPDLLTSGRAVCSLLCYSSERQLSLDLVNVGRQRLDFLPMMENSGSARESSARTGTFAQEIIALVHQVRGQSALLQPHRQTDRQAD